MSVGDTPVRLTVHKASPERTSVRVPSGAGSSVFLGGADVTSTDGFEIAPGDSLTIDVDPGDSLYGVCAATQSATIHVLNS